ncbi:MAG: hypothetical protein LQ338_004661 [Usnochroma carphineum]|nr:MAG: hypothetical protein LQ338_004661 [Usnochroma carphineum]
MLPDFLQSNFKRYKQDTDIVATWLAVKAKQHGYPVDIDGCSKSSSKSKRLKGKARKQSKDSASQTGPLRAAGGSSEKPRHTVKIKDFISLAEFIAGYTNPIIQVPVTLVKALNRAIALRAQHNDWSRQSRSGDDKETRINADATHSYFLGVLDRVREILRPRMPAKRVTDEAEDPVRDKSATMSASIEEHDEVSNRFDMLDLEEPSQSFLDAPGVSQKPKAETLTEPSYEAETDQSREEKYLASHCLFQDIRNIRSFVRHLWNNYKEHKLSLVSVSVATNTAIGLVRDMEEDFVRRFPGTSGFEDIVDLFYQVQALWSGESPEKKERPDDLFNFKVYDLAEDCLVTTYTTLSSLQDVVEPGILPVYKPGHFGFRDRSKDWDDMTPRGKFKEDQLILFEAFPDLVLLGMITSRSPLAEDELIRGVRDMLPGRPIPLWLVFAGRCFLDAQHALSRDVGLGYEQLARTGLAMKTSIKENLGFHKSLRVETWPKPNDFQFTEMLGVVDSWVLRDVVAERRGKIKMHVRIPDAEPFFLLRQYPLLCGLFAFALKARYQELCVAFANAWGSIMYTGHLYNAVRQEKLLRRAWKDMEIAITLQSPEVFFVGDSPSSLEEYGRRFMLCIGVSASAFSSNRRRNAPVASTKGPRSLKVLGPVWKLFGGRYCNNDRDVGLTSESIKPIIETKLDDEDEDEARNEESKRVLQPRSVARKAKLAKSGSLITGRTSNPGAIPAVDFLQDIAYALHAEGFELSLDYLLLHRTCWRFLRQVNERCKPKLLEMYGGGYLDKEGQLPLVVGYIFDAATETSKLANQLLPKRTEGATSRLLLTAAEAIRDYFSKGGDDVQAQVLRELHGYNIDFSELTNSNVDNDEVGEEANVPQL